MKPVIPVFFAADDNYLPFLAVSLGSVKANASKNYDYNIHILHSGLDSDNMRRTAMLDEDGFTVRFDDVTDKLSAISKSLQLRDYYTGTTYYRIFIAEMFPEYEKALYLDSDTVVLGDISELYNHELGDNLVGAVTDETVSGEPVFCDYVQKALGISPDNYFNAGILLMNLKAFRRENFYEGFNRLLRLYKFSVAQDQDYLNVLCRGRVLYISSEWNKMPMPTETRIPPKLIHYNLTRKPWHYNNVPYREYFWEYARKSEFYREIIDVRDSFTDERKLADSECEKRLIALAAREAADPANYYRKYAAM